MSFRLRLLLLSLTLVALAASTLRVVETARADQRTADARAARAERAARAKDVAFFRRRVAGDPWGATDRAQLAALHLAGARAGNPVELSEAERLARESLALRRGRNDAAALVLINALMGQHRFGEALDEAARLSAAEPENTRLQGLVGEILLELGRYEEAGAAFRRAADGDLSTRMRLARWHELRGELASARRLIHASRDEARGAFGLSRQQRAWFELRVAEFALRYGTPGEARAALDAGLRLVPDDPQLLLSAGRLALEQGAWADASEHASRVLAMTGDPSALALLYRAEKGRGDRGAAEAAIAALALTVAGQPGGWHRDWILALLDAGRDVPALRRRVEDDLATRRDVYGWDLVAWARHRDGDRAGARVAMRQALALGTRDPLLLAHAQAIGVEPSR